MSPRWRRRLTALSALFAALWNLSLVLLRGLVPLLLLAMVGLLAWALLAPQPWPFSISVETEHATLVLAPGVDTQWRVGGATLCVRRQVAPLPLPPIAASRCGGARWQAYDLGGSPEATLVLAATSPAADDAATVSLDMEPDGALAVQVADSAARLLSAPPGSGAQLPLGDRLILVFAPPPPEAPPGRLLLPFAGGGMLGRDVTWSEPSLLRQGEILLYTRSDEAVGGRDLVATTSLLPGDRVDLGHGGADGWQTPITKGFVHVDLRSAPEAPPVMRVVAFGEADSVRILRFGEQGYRVSPGLLARISRHSAVATWAVLIFTLLGLVALYQGCATLGEGTLPTCWQDVRARLRGLRAPFDS